MVATPPPGWPGDDAARDGAPLDTSAGPPDPRLVAAERVIRQLRSALGAMVAVTGQDAVLLTREQLGDARLRGMRIVVTAQGVRVELPAEPAEGRAADHSDTSDTSAEGGDRPHIASGDVEGASGSDTVLRAGDSALMRRLEQVVAERTGGGPPPAKTQPPGADEDDPTDT